MTSTAPIHNIATKTPFEFEPEKALHTLLYIAQQLGAQADLYHVLKAAYFADRRHLERYGRFIFGDTYRRIAYGPVPVNVYKMIGHVRKGKSWAPGTPIANGMLKVQSKKIVPLMAPNMDAFSESDLECLDEAIAECRPLSFNDLKERSHADLACQQTPLNGFMDIFQIAATLPNSAVLLEYLRDPCPG